MKILIDHEFNLKLLRVEIKLFLHPYHFAVYINYVKLSKHEVKEIFRITYNPYISKKWFSRYTFGGKNFLTVFSYLIVNKF